MLKLIPYSNILLRKLLSDRFYGFFALKNDLENRIFVGSLDNIGKRYEIKVKMHF